MFLSFIFPLGCANRGSLDDFSYSLNTNIVDDKNSILNKYHDIQNDFQNMIQINLDLTITSSNKLHNISVVLDKPQNNNIKAIGSESSDSTIVKKGDRLHYSFDIILDQSLFETEQFLERMKLIITWYEKNKKQEIEIPIQSKEN
jgi:hypothetical protein